MKPFIVALTGASGAVYGIRVVQALTELGHKVELIVSEPARLVMREELGQAVHNLAQTAERERVFGAQAAGLIEVHSPRNFAASIASGSYPTQGMVIVPCSMGTLGAIASGLSQNLIHRAADCIMKEGRQLVLVPRETPLSAIHLENMLKLSRLGVRIVPAMPAFYSGAAGLKDMVDFMAGKVLDQLGLAHALYPRWTGTLLDDGSACRQAGVE